MARGGIASVQAQLHLDTIFATEPERTEQAMLCVRAWFDLSTERPIGWVIGPIPWSRIVAWCGFHELDHDLSVVVINVIRSLDNDRAEAEAAERSAARALGNRASA